MTQDLVLREQIIRAVDAEEMDMVLRVAYERGRLLVPPREIPRVNLADGRQAVKVQMLGPVPKVRSVSLREFLAQLDREHPVAAAIGKALTFAAACFVALMVTLFGVGYLVFQGAPRLGPAVTGCLLAVSIAGFPLGRRIRRRRPACSGLHCSGCGRH